MDAPYPGKGLSPSQLVFALNQELRHTAYSPIFTSDIVSHLERDLSTALVIVRGWKNSFAPINCIPLDVLSLIPTHLASHKDRFRASFVCSHWRKVFLQRGALWSQLFLGKGEEYVKTLLKRAKGSALDIITGRHAPPGTITLLSPRAREIEHLNFPPNLWSEILTFSQVVSGSLPLLRTLRIHVAKSPLDQLNELTPPSLPLFSGAINLKEFYHDSELAGTLNHFVFPNLTTFKLSVQKMDRTEASHLFDFLKASPTLRTFAVTIDGGTVPGSTSQDTAVVLPNVEKFSLLVRDNRWQVYEPVVHISCPRAKHTLLAQEICDDDMAIGLELFPNSALWKAINNQYTTIPVEEVTLKIEDDFSVVAYSLDFRSSDATVISLGFEVTRALGFAVEPLLLTSERMTLEIFSQACRTIRDLPLLSHLKGLHIEGNAGALDLNCVDVVGDLFRSLGPLDELTIDGFDIHIFLAPYIDLPEFQHFQRVFPSVKELTITERADDEERCPGAIVELAKSQHELGKPFERVTFHANWLPAALAERLRQWVSVADCHELPDISPEEVWL